MKFKTFILTFLMMMSCSISFGQGSLTGSATTEAQLWMHLNDDEIGTISLANDIKITATCPIPNGKKVTIDLNGYELFTEEEIYIIKNEGKLTITDNSEGKTGTISSTLGIYNGVTPTRTSVTDVKYDRVLTINGGVFNSSSENGNAATIYNYRGVIKINGGEFYGEHSAITNYGMATIANAYIECLNRDNGAAAIINDYEIAYGENVNIVGIYTTVTQTAYTTGTEPTYLFAELNGVKYPSLQAALDSCTTGDNTIKLLFHNSKDATVSQKEGVKIIIDGDGYKDKQFEYSGTITVDGKSAAYATAGLTIEDVKFNANNITKDASINLGGNNSIRYTSNVTVKNCTFEGVDKAKVAIKNYTGGCKNLVVKNCEATGLHSLVQVKGIAGVTVENVKVTDCKNGISVGTSDDVAIKGADIEAEGYGLRSDGSGAYSLTVENSKLTADVPVIVRKTTGEYDLTVAADVTLTAANNGPQVVVTAGDDEDPYVAPTAKINVTLNNDASTFGLVAKIGNKYYSTLDEAFAVATEDQTIVLLADATPVLTSQRAITKAAVIDLGGKTLTLTEDDLYFGTTEFKNGNIIVDPSVNASTAVFWMFENQTLTFDNVNITANGVTGTYLIGINGGTGSAVNLLNNSSIIIDNESQAELTAVICDNGTGNNVIIKDSYINVNNIEGRFYLGGTSGNITVDNTDIDLNGVNEGFYLRANQTLSIEGESEVEVVLNDTNNCYGINITDYSATYTKDDLATVNATVYDPVVRVKNLTELQTALVENVDKPIFATETIVISEGTLELDLNTRRVFAAGKNVIRNDGATLTIKNGTIERVGDAVGYAFNNAQGALNITGTTIKGGLYTSGTSLVATNANISHFQSSRHAIYAFNCNVTLNGGTYHNDNSGNATIMAAGSSVVTIKDGTFSIKDGRQELGWTSCLTDTEGTASITVEGGTFNGGFRVQTGTTMTIEGGSFNDCYGSGYNINAEAVVKVKGGTFTDANAINFAKGNLAEGYVASDNGNGTFTVLKGVAKIGDTYYATLQAAINAVQDGETVTLVNDITYTDYVYASGKTTAVNIANGKNFTLNLNGKSITGTNATENNYELVTIAKGTKLTIEDSSADKTGKISYTGTRETNDGWIRRCHTIFNQGTLVLNGGTIENNTPATAEAVASAIDNNASWGNEGYLTVNGGTVISTSYYAVRTDVNTHNTTANSTLKAQTTFNDGIVYGFYLMDRGSDIAQWPSNAIEFAVGDNATIKPCEYNGQALRFRVNTKSAYDLTVSENATIEGTIKGAVTVVGNKYYAYLQDAIDACVAGDNIITLREDVTEDVTVIQKEGVNVVIDGAKDAENNYTFTGLMSVDGNARQNGEETLTIKNINFVAKEGVNACITAAKGSANYCYSHNLTVENCTFTDPDGVVDCAAIRQPSGIGGGCVNWTVKNCSVDETMHSLMNTSNINNLVVKDCIIDKSKSGLNLNNSDNVTLEGNNFDVQTYALRAGENGETPAANKYVLKNNTMKSACDGGDAVIIFRNTASAADFSMTQNVVSGATHISGHTKDTQLSVDANYWDGEENPVADPAIRVNSYYADAELQNLVHNYHGDNFIGYTDEFKIWGEVWGNAFESFVIKVLDKNGKVMGTTSLNDVDGFIDGDVTATWSLLFDVASNSDPYWTMSWTSRPTVANMPASVELYVDGHKVGEGPVQLNNPDNLEKKTVAIVDNDGYIKVFYASFDQAYKASKTGDVLELLETAVITNTSSWVNYSTRQITVNARNINPAFRVQDNAFVWFGGMTINSYDGYCIIVGAEDASSGANVEIYGGTYNGVTTAISVTKGDVNILGGTFQVEPYEGSYEYTINCIDAAYNNNDADVSIKGGKFYNFNPQNNAAEGPGTNFLTAKYAAYEDADNYWNVVPAEAMIVDNGKTQYYATLQDAVSAATDGQTVTLCKNINESVNISKLEKNITIDGNDYGTTHQMKGLSIGSDDNNLDAGVVTIKNIAFNGKGLSVKELANVTIQNNTFTNITEGNAITVICDNLTEKVNVSANTITNVEAGTGIRIRNAKEAAVTGNKVSEIFNNAILLEGNTTGDIAVTDNVLSNWGKDVEEKGRAIRIVKGENTNATITGNAMLHDNAPEQFVKISGNTENVNVNENYWNGQNPFAEELFTDDNNYNAYPQSYYAKYDAATNELSELVTISYVAKIGKVQYLTFEAALNAVQNNETITVLNVEGSENKELEFTKDIEFTITGEAPNYALPVVTFQNATVNISNAEILIPELDARQKATINVINSTVYDAGGDGIVKSYYNGAINIDANSTVYTMQVTTMGYITVAGTLNATWQTNVYGNGLITLNEGATFATAGLNLIAKDYDGRDNTDADRVGKPAEIVVDNANFTVGKVYSASGADYSYHADEYGINVGTIEGKSAILTIENGGNVNIYTGDGKTANIGADGTVNIEASTFNVECRAENGTATLANNGTVNVTGEANLAAANVTGNGWFYMNGVTLDADTKLLGAKVRFASGTNNIDGSTIDDGFFQVGIGAYNGTDANVDTENGVVVNVNNAVIGANGDTYAGWAGTGFYDTDTEKAAAMTSAKYVLNIENSIAEFGYLHISNDGELKVNGNATEKAWYNNSDYSFYAGDFIINGTATFDATDVLAIYTKVSCDNGTTDNPGTLNIVNGTEYEAERHNGAVAGLNFDIRKTGVANVAEGANLHVGEPASIAADATMNIGGTATVLGELTNDGTINFTSETATLTVPTTGLTVNNATGNNDIKVVYENGTYKFIDKHYVAEIVGGAKYESLAEAATAAQNGETIQLLWNEGDAAISMAASFYGKNVTITGDAKVDWSKDWFFVGRGGEGNATVTFDGANLTSASANENSGLGIHVSGREKDTDNKYDGTLVIKNRSNIELDYLIDRGAITIDNATLTVNNGFGIAGRPASETEDSDPATATISLKNGAKLIVDNHNGMGVGQASQDPEGYGIMNIDATSTFETKRSFLVTANGTMNVNGGNVNIAGTLDNDGTMVVAAESNVEVTENLNVNGTLNSAGNITGAIVKAATATIQLTGGIYTTEPQDGWCAESYGAFPYDGNSWVVREISGEQTFALQAGWNWMSSYISEFDTDGLTWLKEDLSGQVGAQIKNNLHAVTKYEQGWFGSLTNVSVKEMYKVKATADITFTHEGSYVNYDECEIVLYPGWNYISYPVNEEMNLIDALAKLQPSPDDIIKRQDASATYAFGAWRSAFTLTPGQGYMYKNASDEIKSLYYTTKKTTSTDSNNRSSKYWTVDATQYPSNMTMIAMTDVEGGDYEVAAFVNGELRGSSRPVYVEELDAHILILTISGDEVAEVTFKYYDIATGEEVAFSNRINYSNDAIVGSMAEPYMLTRGTTGIGEASLSEINIYPNPTTTGTEINLQATCDKVEVFNALGVKVAEYQNVDTIDALETAGIYVIRITNDSNVQNCRLVVK